MEDNLLFRIVQYERTAANREEKRYTFKYDDKKRVSTMQEVRLVAPFVNYEYGFHYDVTSRVDTVRQYQLFNAGPKLVETYGVRYENGNVYTYCWKNNCYRYEYDDVGNLSKLLALIPSTAPNERALRLYSNFDGKKNLYATSQPARLINLVMGEGNSVGNPGVFNVYDGGATPTQTGIVTYQYNEKQFPTEASVSTFAASGTPLKTQVYKFTYECT